MSEIITRPADVNNLPHSSVVLISNGTARQKDNALDWHKSGGWISAGSDVPDVFYAEDFPLTVIYNPEEA